jgi:transposase
VLVDESGFYPLAAVATTWAPVGQTPVLVEWQTRDHLSVISGITPDGRSAFQTHTTTINGELAARFLKHLQHTLGERLLVIWDGSPIHRSRAVKAVLAQAAGRIWLERLPGYAPDLNPDEGVWQHLKQVQLANVCSPDLDTHRHELQNAIRRFKRRQTDLIPEFFNHAGL